MVLLLVLTAPGAAATIGWCKKDPIADIGGKRAHIYVSSPVDIIDLATGPTQVAITVPAGVEVDLIATDDGFGYGWDVSFAESRTLQVTERGIEVQVSTYVPASAKRPVATELTDGADVVLARRVGTTNAWNTLTGVL